MKMKYTFDVSHLQVNFIVSSPALVQRLACLGVVTSSAVCNGLFHRGKISSMTELEMGTSLVNISKAKPKELSRSYLVYFFQKLCQDMGRCGCFKIHDLRRKNGRLVKRPLELAYCHCSSLEAMNNAYLTRREVVKFLEDVQFRGAAGTKYALKAARKTCLKLAHQHLSGHSVEAALNMHLPTDVSGLVLEFLSPSKKRKRCPGRPGAKFEVKRRRLG